MKSTFVLAAVPWLMFTTAYQSASQVTEESVSEAASESPDEGIDCSLYDGKPLPVNSAQATVSGKSKLASTDCAHQFPRYGLVT